jgi:hypothetical protein
MDGADARGDEIVCARPEVDRRAGGRRTVASER